MYRRILLLGRRAGQRLSPSNYQTVNDAWQRQAEPAELAAGILVHGGAVSKPVLATALAHLGRSQAVLYMCL
jgi:hypothetical protein